MALELKLCVFGDQTCDLKPHWNKLLQSRENPIVEDFLTKAYDAVRKELYKLPPEMRDEIPRFTCFNDLVLTDRKHKRCVALDTAVSCIYQLGTFIR